MSAVRHHKTAEVSNDTMETADINSEISKAAEVSNEAPGTAEVCSSEPITADVKSDDPKSADVGINGDRDAERMEQKMDTVSLQEPEQQTAPTMIQIEATMTQTEQKTQQWDDTGDIQEAQMHKVVECKESEAPTHNYSTHH